VQYLECLAKVYSTIDSVAECTQRWNCIISFLLVWVA